jgi:hypothetical protein
MFSMLMNLLLLLLLLLGLIMPGAFKGPRLREMRDDFRGPLTARTLKSLKMLFFTTLRLLESNKTLNLELRLWRVEQHCAGAKSAFTETR